MYFFVPFLTGLTIAVISFASIGYNADLNEFMRKIVISISSLLLGFTIGAFAQLRREQTQHGLKISWVTYLIIIAILLFFYLKFIR